MPAMGESVTEGVVAHWVKGVGDPVTEGETVVEVTTDKVDIEVPSPVTGILSEIAAEEGATVPVGGVLARITPDAAFATPPAAPGEPAPAPTIAAQPAAERPAGAVPGEATPAPQPPPPRRAGAAPASRPGATAGSPAAATPLARRRAALAGLDLAAVRGSGPAGLVRRDDVVAAARPRGPDVPAGAAPAPAAAPAGAPALLRGPRAALVEAMERSRDIPTATSIRTIPAGTLDHRRRQLNAALQGRGDGLKVSFTHLIAYAVARAAAEMPGMRVHFERDPDGRPLSVPGGVHLGLAVDTRRADGTRFLVVPVLRDAASRDFADFRTEYERLIGLARTASLSPDDLSGATLTLTNPGGLGTVASIPRLMPGQGCIIAAGAIGHPPEYRGVPEERLRELGVGRVVTLTSTYDHRVIQGAESGELLGRIEALLAGADGFYDAVFASLGLAAPAGGAPAERPPGPSDLAAAPPPSAATPAAAAGDRALPSAAPAPPAAPGGDRTLLAAMQAATSLVKAHRTHGHLGARLDPLGTPPPGDPSLEPETYRLTPELMERIPADLLRVYVPGRTLAEVLPNLRRTYCGTIAYEIEHISSHEQRLWLREQIESGAHRTPLSAQEKLRLLWRLTKVDAMERYFRRSFIGQKTFSGEGVDMLVPMLEKLLGLIAEDGTSQVVMGMAHRARLAVIAHVVNRPYEDLLRAFEKGELRVDDPAGDVKYHLGSSGTYVTEDERRIEVRLLSNPSHLEAVDAVVEGWTRALQTGRAPGVPPLDHSVAAPILIHGDAAFTGEGAVQEVLNLHALPGYSTGGTVHVIIDNQLGFTTDRVDARSTRYASDLAKGFDIPIVHVNADDPEACVAAARLAHAYRRTYRSDVVIDLIGYRRFGHNETDEPAYTQPVMYRRIREHPTARELFVRQLVAEGLITEEEAKRQSDEVFARITDAHHRVKERLTTLTDNGSDRPAPPRAGEPLATVVPEERLRAVNRGLFAVPDGFVVNAKLHRQLQRRQATLDEGGIDWGHAEALALGSLLLEGIPVRLTGQDTERGTFSHRHMVLHSETDGSAYAPIQHLEGARATLEVHNSPLSEMGALGFEYGYSAAEPGCLVIWEAQFGDFANVAQPVIDQFVVAAQAKWGQRSRLVLLLPHGYEGMGPEHSSARVERFLQLAANGNIRVANCSTSAQYFHLLRDQALAPEARPLVIMTPKSLLRAPETACTLGDLTEGGFQAVIDDPEMSRRPGDVRVLLLCTGKIYWELEGHELRRSAPDLAIGRLELLDPLPLEAILGMVKRYPRLEKLYWVQEEPENMGAWNHLQRRIGRNRPYEVSWEYIGRPRRASPSEGYHGSHVIEQERVLRDALLTSAAVRAALQAAPPGGTGDGAAVPPRNAAVNGPAPRRAPAGSRPRRS
jgi:2-oxoglutarate decarboxylase